MSENDLTREEPNSWPAADANPLDVDESADNDYPTDDDIKEAQDNYDHMPPSLKLYVDALNRKFPS